MKVLILVTNHATLGNTEQPNGTYAPEITHVVDVLQTANVAYDIASIEGGKAPLYGEDTENDDVNSRVLNNESFINQINNTVPVSQINASDYQAVFYPGGFGLLSDLAQHENAAKISSSIYASGGVISAVCHGPAGLLPITLENGQTLLETVSVTGFTREEEIDFGTISDIPFLLEESLARNAKQYNKVQPWGEFIVVDGRVITGQNPASAHAVGKELLKQLQS